MAATLLSGFGALPGWNVSLLLLLAKATIILIAALCITLAMTRASATARHLVWLVTLGTLLLVPALTAWAPLRLAILPANQATAPAKHETSALTTSDALGSGAPEGSLRAGSVPGNTAVIDAKAPIGASEPLGFISRMSGVSLVFAIWGAVVLAIALTLAWAGLSVRRIVHNARPLESNDWLTPLFEIADRIGLEEAPRLLQSSEAKMPFACGILKPTIVLPLESESWTLDRRRAVLLHELAHVRRHDLLGHTLGRLVCAVYWFHPLVWTAAKRLRSESERACDDLALACGTRATDYAEHLLDIVTSVRGDSTPLVALAMARRKEFEGRMLAILDPDLRHSTPSRRQSAALIASLALISLTVGAIAPVARTADAAVVAETSHSAAGPSPAPAPAATPAPTPAPMAVLRDTPIAAPMRSQAYPDSGVPGVTSKSISFSKSTMKMTSTTQSTTRSPISTEVSHVIAANDNMNAEITALADASVSLGAKVGVSAAAAALKSLGIDVDLKGTKGDKGDKGAKGSKQSDDRPALLAKVLKTDTSASIRRVAAWALHEHAELPVATEALVGALRRDADWKVREMSAWALSDGGRGSSDVLNALTTALKSDADERVRATAAWALGDLGDRSSADALAGALSDASPSVRQRAAWALGNIDPRTAPKALVALLGDKDPHVRTVASWALYNISDPATAPAIEAALKVEKDQEVQLAMIRAIGSLGERSVDAIRGLLESPDQRVRSMAVHALAGGHASGPWPWPWPQPRPFP
ncbi:MAG: HEAT repeat domain-containing protein [bacterium]